MVLTAQFKLKPTAEQAQLLDATMREYISLTNDILDYANALGYMPKLSSATVKGALPSALRDQCRLDAASIYKKTIIHNLNLPTLKKPVAFWNSQNYKIGPGRLEVPMLKNGKSKRVHIAMVIPPENLAFLNAHKPGALRITKKNGKYVAQIAYTAQEQKSKGTKVMGVDLGIKCPAVAVTDGKKTKFYGNGRKNKFVRRRYHARRKKLGKAKKLSAIRRSSDKEQRWMKDQDHKVSRAIVNDAIAAGVKTIKLEELSGIRASARKSRKNNRSLHSWSFYRLSQFIEYKAALAGIEVQYVNPAYTSQTCPCCGARNHANDRNYKCRKCGYHTHRDRVGAVNIYNS